MYSRSHVFVPEYIADRTARDGEETRASESGEQSKHQVHRTVIGYGPR